MDYPQTLDYLFSRLPMFSRVGSAAIKNGLDNTLHLLEKLGNSQKKFRTIHVAGTNGKGSVSHMLASILQQAGYKTALYTSPHLKDFRERIKVNGAMVSEDYVCEFVEKQKEFIEKIEPSFFEITVAMAFDYFAQENVDIAVIETGLGGRLDSTNVITPVLSIITNIGKDHEALLGNTLERIAAEKAGIIKQHVPVVIGEYLEETKPVFLQKALQEKAAITFAQEKYECTSIVWENDIAFFFIKEKSTEIEKKYRVDLPGIYQQKNIITVLTAVDELNNQGLNISHNTISKALEHIKGNTGFYGRWEIVHHNPKVVLDVAHNVDGIKQILLQLSKTSFNAIHIILGMVRDKDYEQVLSLLPKTATYYFTQSNIPRALPMLDLQTSAHKMGLYGNTFNNVNIALQEALKQAALNDLILICGSVFLVGEVEMKSLKYT